MKQRIMLAEFNVDGNGGIAPMFYPLVDTSKLKELKDNILQHASADNITAFNDKDVALIMSSGTLLELNQEGWMLQSILAIRDSRHTMHQVGIFNNENIGFYDDEDSQDEDATDGDFEDK